MKCPEQILVFGATSAIAYETEKIFASNGISMFLCGRDEDELKRIARDLSIRGAKEVDYCVFDALDDNSVDKAIDHCLKRFPSVDGVFIAHGSLPDQKLCETDLRELNRALKINYISTVHILTRLANHFEKQSRGKIIVISSPAGDRGRQSNYIYGSAKGALSIFLSGLRQRLFKSGIHVITVKPGFVTTPMTSHLPSNPLFVEPAVIARGIYKAVTSNRDEVYLPWYWRIILLILKHAPEKIYKRLNL
jgi:short-subunit dehydrogenase